MKKTEAALRSLKKVQDASDDDLDTDIVESTRKHSPHHRKNTGHCPSACGEGDEYGDEPQESPEEERKSTRTLAILLGGFMLVAIIFVLILVFYKPSKQVMTLDDMHEANIAGNLKPDQGYVYNGFSFVKFSGIWYSQLAKGNTMYDVTFNNDPKSVEDIPVEGMLSQNFRQGNKLYITFDPDARGTKYITVANAGLSMGLVKAFGYDLSAGCTSNESATCRSAGVITCEDPDKAVIYFKEAEETRIILDDNCVTVQGYGPEIVRAKDRLLMRWYGMMD